MPAALRLTDTTPAVPANDNAALSARAKVTLRLAAQRPIDSQDRLSRRVFDASGALVHTRDFGNNKTADYIRANGETVARWGQGHWIFDHKDHLGSTVAATHMNGNVNARVRYAPFGLAMDDPTKLRDGAGFTSHLKDSDTGLNYMQARYYDPIMGRFLSIDPVTFISSGGNPGYFNRYAYTFNDPVNNIDPDGQQVVQDGVLKVTVSVGGSAKGGLGSQGKGQSIGVGLDVLAEIGIGLPSSSRGEPVPLPFVSLGVVTIDGVGVTGSITDADTFSGAQIDSDVGEIGISLGDIDDRGGRSSTLEGDFELLGAEVSSSGEIAGSTIKVDFFGPGIGGSISETDTIIAEEHRFDDK